MSFCNDCCDVFGIGQRLIEKKVVELDYSVYDDFYKQYPYVNDGCGCCSDEVFEINCEEKFQYRYKSFSIDYETILDFVEDLNDTVERGGTELYSSSDPTYENIEPTYYSCECKEITKVPLNCIEFCENGEKRDNNKTITTSISENTEFTPCPNPNGCYPPYADCANLGVDYCLGEDPIGKGIVTSGKCEHVIAYFDPNFNLQDVVETYSDRIDMFNLPWDTGLEKLKEIQYPNVWDDTQDCYIIWWNESFWNPNDSVNGVTVDFSASKSRLFSSSGQVCGIQPSVGQNFKKVKFRWRFLIPSSCYIKIWICRYNAKKLIKSLQDQYTVDVSLEGESIESYVMETLSTNGKCFDGFKNCGDHELSYALSPEFELISPSIEFPEEDPDESSNSFTELTKYEGISIIGLSYVDGWEPPLFKYSEDVWKSNFLMNAYVGSPYWMPDDLNKQQFKKGVFWPNTPEKTQEAIDYFNNIINVVDAP